MDPFRGAGVLALVATILGSTSLIPAQFDATTATWRVRATPHFDIYYTHARDLDAIAREAEHAYARVSHDIAAGVCESAVDSAADPSRFAKDGAGGGGDRARQPCGRSRPPAVTRSTA